MIVPTPKPDRRVARSKQALQNALLSLMEHKTFASISITEIADRANYNRGTFYMHYENKNLLLEEIILHTISELIVAYRAPYQGLKELRVDLISSNAVTIFDHIYENASLYSSLLRSEVLSEFREKMTQALIEVAQQDFLLSGPAATEQVDQQLFVIYHMHALTGLVIHWIQNGFQPSVNDMEEQILFIARWRPEISIR